MPKDEFDFDDPMELSGVALFTEEDTTGAMCECFIEEFMRMGHNPGQILALFRSPNYLGPNMVLQHRGEPYIRDQIAEVFARWGRAVASSGSTPRPLIPSRSPTVSACRAQDPEATGAGQDSALSEPTPRDSLSPQRGEGRGEGCDRPQHSRREAGAGLLTPALSSIEEEPHHGYPLVPQHDIELDDAVTDPMGAAIPRLNL
jgi:hypothetical protein